MQRGGAERVMSILANAWVEDGKHKVTLVTVDSSEPPAYTIHPDVVLKSLEPQALSTNAFQRITRNISRVRLLRRAIRESKPDIVVSFIDRTNVLTILATLGTAIPVIVSERCEPPGAFIGPAWRVLRNISYLFADVLVCQTPAALVRFQAHTRVSGIAIPNPVPKPPAAPPTSRSGHSLIAMGRLSREKGFDLLLQAFAQLAGKHPDWTLSILGSGPLLGELEGQARSLGIASRVSFAGAVSDPFTRLSNADMFVFSSRSEGFGMALAEAMACGLAVVSFNCPEGPALIVRDGVDGVLVPPEDVAGLTAALDRLMGNSRERQRLAGRATEVLEHFSVERALLSWQQLFDQVIANHRGKK
jgi:glycosyltransferase involved in cell wall biosynthesis